MLCGVIAWTLISACLVSRVSPIDQTFNATIVSIFLKSSELSFDANVVISAIRLAVEGVSNAYPHIKFDLVVRNSSRYVMHALLCGVSE